ncbi:MAG: phage Gp37/Gp68 family protein [Planctomycetaceae bacterium]|nr:phage Gp37/Gp68 family protein [Planctomycetaceae bacterium]
MEHAATKHRIECLRNILATIRFLLIEPLIG